MLPRGHRNRTPAAIPKGTISFLLAYMSVPLSSPHGTPQRRPQLLPRTEAVSLGLPCPIGALT
jgi:hypothetical protein